MTPPTDDDCLIRLDDVSFAYGSRPILSGINLRIPRGKVVAIMGSSGCGKTTTLRLIGGQLKPTRGQVWVAGQEVSSLDSDALYALRRRMGMLFQFGALFTDMSVYDNVAFQMREHTDLPEALIHDLVMMKLQSVGLRGAHDLMPAELSGGMARRVDYVYFVSAGRIVAEGTPQEIRAATTPYVHQFIWGEADGPVPFHYPAPAYGEALMTPISRAHHLQEARHA